MAKILRFLSTSKDKRHLIQVDAFFSNIQKVQNELEVQTDTIFLSDNKDGLSKIYNRFIDKCRIDNVDFAMMIHSDVFFDYFSVVEHYLKICDKYDVVGLAGTRKIQLSISPLTWFTGSRNFPNQRYGRVTHRQYDLGESFFNRHSPETKDIEVSTIDGLCMILNQKAIQSDVRFDEMFSFDFYDLDYCLSAITSGMKIGVMVEPVIHESVGTSILKPEYLIPEKKFREKWNLTSTVHQ